MLKNTLLLCFLSLYLLSGCSDDGSDYEGKADHSAVKEEHVWRAQVQSLEKAKGVEAMILDAEQNQRREIDDSVFDANKND